jgi:hypothetical protein
MNDRRKTDTFLANQHWQSLIIGQLEVQLRKEMRHTGNRKHTRHIV